MDDNAFSTHRNSRKGLSASEFQKNLYNWFENRGLLDDLRAQLRHQMVVALRDTSLGPSTSKPNISVSPKIQAINLLIAEFLLHHEHHYTLSVFTSEIPLLRTMPEFTVSGNHISGRSSGTISGEGVPRFQHHDVKDILDTFGLPIDSEIGSRIYAQYHESTEGIALLTCILQNVSERRTNNAGSSAAPSRSELPVQKSKSNTSLEDGGGSEKESKTVKKIKELYKVEMHKIVYQSQLKSQHIKQLQEQIRRFQETEVEKIRKEEEEKSKKLLLAREAQLQTEMSRREEEITRKLEIAEAKLAKQKQAVENELRLKRQQLSELATELEEQKMNITRKHQDLEVQAEQLKQEQKRIEELKQKDTLQLAERTSLLDVRQQQLQEEFERLNAERETMSYIQYELEDSRRQLMEARQSLAQSHSELSFLRNIQHQCSHLRYELDATRLKLDNLTEMQMQQKTATIPIPEAQHEQQIQKLQPTSSITAQQQQQPIETADKGLKAVWTKHADEAAAVVKTAAVQVPSPSPTPENIPEIDSIANLDLIKSQQELQQQQHYLTDVLRQVQQENEELRGHTQQQRLRIDELTTHATDLANQLEDAHTAITLLSNRPDHDLGPPDPRFFPPVFMSSGSGTITVPPLIAPPQPPPPPPLPPHSPRHVRRLGAGEELSYTPPAITQHPPLTFGSSSSQSNTSVRREWRKKPPRRLTVHSNSNSSDETSPTDEVLQEARKRLRKLEEESEAVDQSYQNFRRRHHESLGETASILFPAIPSLHLQYRNSSLGYGSYTSSQPLYSAGGSHTPIIYSNFNYSPPSSMHATLFNPFLSNTTSRFPLYHRDRLSSAQFGMSSGLQYSFAPRPQVSGTMGNTTAMSGMISSQQRLQAPTTTLVSQSRIGRVDTGFSLPPQPSTSTAYPRSHIQEPKDKVDTAKSTSERRNSPARKNMFDACNMSSRDLHNQHQIRNVTFGSPLKTTMVYTRPQVSALIQSPAKNLDKNGSVITIQSYTGDQPITSPVESSTRVENDSIANRNVIDSSGSSSQGDEYTASKLKRYLSTDRLNGNKTAALPSGLSTDNIWQLRHKLSSYFNPNSESENHIKNTSSIDKDITVALRESKSTEASDVQFQKLFPSSETPKSHTTVSEELHPAGSFAFSETTGNGSNDESIHPVPFCSVSGNTFSSSIKDYESTSTDREPSVTSNVDNNSEARQADTTTGVMPTRDEEILSEKSVSATQTTIRAKKIEIIDISLDKMTDFSPTMTKSDEIKKVAETDILSTDKEPTIEQSAKKIDSPVHTQSSCLQDLVKECANNGGPSSQVDTPEQIEEIQIDKAEENSIKNSSQRSQSSNDKIKVSNSSHMEHKISLISKEISKISTEEEEEESEAVISVGGDSKKDESSNEDFW